MIPGILLIAILAIAFLGKASSFSPRKVFLSPKTLSGGNGNWLPPRVGSRLFALGEDATGNRSEELVDEMDASNEQNPFMKQWKSISAENREDIKTTTISLVVALLIRAFIIEPRFIPSLSMFPTFDIGDQLLVDKVTRLHKYHRRDVVVFNPSETYTEMTGNTEALIKRVVGIAGDTVQVKAGIVYVNGVAQDEPYINERPDYDLPLVNVPEGFIFVLGDNRNHSFDSHIWGFLPENNVIGRAVVKYWPPWRLGVVQGSD